MSKNLSPRQLLLGVLVLAAIWAYQHFVGGGARTDAERPPEKSQSGTHRPDDRAKRSENLPWARSPSQERGTPDRGAAQGEATGGTALVLDAFREERSGIMVDVQGQVKRLLRDDLEGSRHQVFILELENSGHTVKVAHNIDLAPRIPLKEGDTVLLRGQYEFNDQGGVLHWTHHDPAGRRSGGYVEHRGQRYQ
jgi:hypothetical protein